MNNSQQDGQGYFGQAGVSTTNGQFNSLEFQIRQVLGYFRTGTIVRVTAVDAGGAGPVGTVDATPLIGMVDGVFTVTPHETVHGLPYFRLQGGANAIICDPAAGDIGFATISDRDATVVKATKAAGAPGSRRSFSLSDGFYHGGFLNGAPTQYWKFNADGMSAQDMNGNTIVMNAAGIRINGVLIDRSGNVSTAGEITAKSSHTVSQHTHTQGDDSNGDTEVATDKPTG